MGQRFDGFMETADEGGRWVMIAVLAPIAALVIVAQAFLWPIGWLGRKLDRKGADGRKP